ncbi:hypothetical protein, partial [Burkholderia ubonensis]|uniref:hypothetical protein n=1 Tax=Burkholderia ubonensis TaxID=101571 RepID=UPI001E4412DF
ALRCSCHSRAAQKARVNGKPRQFTSRSRRLVCNGMLQMSAVNLVSLTSTPIDETRPMANRKSGYSEVQLAAMIEMREE